MYHNMNYSMIPIILSVVMMIMMVNVMYMLYESSNSMLYLSTITMTTVLIMLVLTLMMQYFMMMKESYQECSCTEVIKVSMRLAFIMFLIMEFMAFNSLFWGYFHFTLTEYWPPVGIIKCDPFSLPLLNTCLLLSSALSLTVFHNYILLKNHNNYTSLIYLLITIMLGVMFMLMQYEEYKDHLMYSLSDGIYGSIFYTLTGFHGSHVTIGIVMLMVTTDLCKYATRSNHKGINAVIWYWHFVDVIWIFLFIFVYMY